LCSYRIIYCISPQCPNPAKDHLVRRNNFLAEGRPSMEVSIDYNLLGDRRLLPGTLSQEKKTLSKRTSARGTLSPASFERDGGGLAATYLVPISFAMIKPTMVHPIISSKPRLTENCSGKSAHKSVFMVISAKRPKQGAISIRDR